MNRKIVAVWVSLAMLFGFVVIVDIVTDFTPTVRATALYVNTTGSGGAYTSIQDAINASNDRDTVFVYNGIYYERIRIINTLNLTGEDRNSTIINASDTGTVVTILSDWANITGFTITCGSLGNDWGITVDSNYNTISDNNIVYNNVNGIYIYSSSVGNRIIDNNISSNSKGGMHLYSRGHNISGNLIHSNGYFGIYLDKASGNNVTNNNIFSNEYAGLSLWSTTENNIYGNVMNEDGIFIRGDQLRYWDTHMIDSSNTVNGKPVYYLINQRGGVIPPNVGQIILANCTGIEINKKELKHTSVGIELGFSSEISVNGNNLSNNGVGIYLYNSSDNELINNKACFNYWDGFHLRYSSYNKLLNNNVSSNEDVGINLGYSNLNTIINNTALLNNERGIGISDSHANILDNNLVNLNGHYGITLYDSNENTVTCNSILNSREGLNIYSSDNNSIIENSAILNSDYGFYIHQSNENIIAANNISLNNEYGLFLQYSDWNHVTGNTIFSNNNYGFYIQFGASNNSIFHNNIIDNTNQVFDDQADNYWDNGYPSGGNYWSDYNGIDLNSTPTQDVPPPDGIGDTPYIIDSDSQDNYPLIAPIEDYIFLKQGWNLISLPLVQENQSLIKVLEMIDGYYDAVQWYNSTDSPDPWKHYKVGKAFGNDLFELNETMSFWIHITQPGDTTFLYNGTQPTQNQTIPLQPGWNMVGYPSLTSYNRTEGLNNLTFYDQVDAIWSYNAGAQKWEEMGESDYFEIGKGYYIHAKSECEWEVPI